ncbi:arginyl-tRNA--protein transferase 1 [Monosporozyma servazzii]
MDLSKRLIITQPMYFSEPSEKCGYCHGNKQDESQFYSLPSWEKPTDAEGATVHYNCTLGFQAESISIEVYDKLCNNGFRRSGKFLYKPDLLRSCCRLFTIRTQPDQVKLTKELKTCVKRFSKYVSDESAQQAPKKNNKAPFDYREIITDAQLNSKRFYSKLEPATFTKEKYELFARYQETIHDDFKHSESGFRRFLCDSPFNDDVVQGTKEEWDSLNAIFSKDGEEVTPHRLGPAHECYYFDDKLIAIGVIDFLPSGISSVYFIYDPDYKHWSLGKLSALKELTLLSRLKLPYYYLGYYVEDCHKMNYKASYGGELLDIVNLEYISLNHLKENNILDGGKLFVMNHDKDTNAELSMNNALKKSGKGVYQSMVELDQLTNVAEQIYGSHPTKGAFAALSQAVEDLQELGIRYTLDSREDIFDFVKDKNTNDEENSESVTASENEHDDEEIDPKLKFPNVVPGLIPLPELRTMVAENQLSELNGNLFLFDLAIHRIRPVFDILEESPQTLMMVCNLVRVLGLELTKQCLVIIT